MPNVKTSRTVTTTDPRARSTSVPISRLIQTTSPLTGGGSLYNDLTLGIDTSSFGDVFTATRNVFTGYNTLSDTLVKGDIQVSGNTEVYGQSRTDWVTTSGYVGTYDQVVAVAGTVLHGGSSISSIVDAVGVRGSVVNSGGGTITNAYGGWFGVQYYPSGVTTTAYGVYIDTVSGSVGYGLYQGGTQPNVLGGALYQGSVAAGTRFVTSGELTTTVTNPVAGLQISGGALIVYSDNTNTPASQLNVPTRGLVIGDQWIGQRFYGLGGETANTGYRWLLYGSGSIAGRLNITANDIGDTVTVGIPVSLSTTSNITARSNMQVSGTLIAYKGIYIKDQTPSPNPLGTYFDGVGHWLLLGSGTTNGSITFAQQQPTDVIRYQAIPTQFISSDVQISGGLLVYSDCNKDAPHFVNAYANSLGNSWNLSASGTIFGTVRFNQQRTSDQVTFLSHRVLFSSTPTKFVLSPLSIESDVQVSGLTLVYNPIHHGSFDAASRYVTSGELKAGSGTFDPTDSTYWTGSKHVFSSATIVTLSGLTRFGSNGGTRISPTGGVQVSGGTLQVYTDRGAGQEHFLGYSANSNGWAWALTGSGYVTGRLVLQELLPGDGITFNSIRSVYTAGSSVRFLDDIQLSGSTLQIYNNQGAGQDYFFRSTADANGVSWALTGSGSITGRLAIQQLLPGDGATLSNYPLYVDGSQLTVGDGALKVLSDSTTRIEGGLQISGATNIAYAPIHQGIVSAANRYVTSGELTAGTGTVTSIVAGHGLSVDPNPITTTGTVGLSDIINFYQDQGLQFQGMAGSTGKIISDPAAEGGGFAGISYALYGSGILQGRLRLNVNQPRDNIITTMPIFHASTAAANRYVTSGELSTATSLANPVTSLQVSGGALIVYSDNTNPPAGVGDVPTRGLVVGDVTTGQRFYGAGAENASSGPRWALHGSGVITGRLQVAANDPGDKISIGIPTTFATAANIAVLGNLQASGLTRLYAPLTVTSDTLMSGMLSVANRIGIGTQTPRTFIQVVSGVCDIRFSQGVLGVLPSLVTINTAGKAAALGCGTNAAAFVFDQAGAFWIMPDTHTNFENDNIGSTTPIIVLDTSKETITVPRYQSTTINAANRYVISGELTAGTIVARDTAQIEWANTRAEQLAVEYAVPAGALTQTRGYRVVAAGALRGSVAAGIVPVVRYGGQALVSGQISTAAGGDPPGSAWSFTCDLLATHASNAQVASATLTIGGTATASGIFTPLVTHGLATNPNIAIDSTLVQPLTATVALGAASPDASALLYYAYVERF